MRQGIEIHQYDDGASALLGIGANNPQVVIAPTDMEGVPLDRFVHAASELAGIPVLVGILATEASQILGFRALEGGARGLIPLPSTAERIAAAIGQLGVLASGSGNELSSGPLHLNPQSLRVTVEGNPVHLAPKEFEVLRYLMAESPRVVGVDEITSHCQDGGPGGETRSRLAIMRTRKKLALASSFGQSFIETVRGVGYRMAL
ncbi:winged helix-turn-helix domain-containing protein [Arthrobacter sp. CAL618]|uniref:winged helix-turn-helix transcriptional regulator n=1 Tax=Arthrobacter sp. CAL618 TaxID=1055770 RepID=UPI001872306D